jgi:hypothetical protein
VFCSWPGEGKIMQRGGEGGGSLEPRTAIELSFSSWGGLEKLDRGRDRGETFFPDSGSDRDSDETFQISRNLGLNPSSSFVSSIHSFAHMESSVKRIY